jgi:F-type H+-transporting ATPase subunit delta
VAVAHRMYARALFDAAKEAGRLAQAHEELTDFAASVREVPELRSVLANPQLDPNDKIAVLTDLLGGADELVRNFLLLLAEKGRIRELDEIVRELDALVAEEERRLTVDLTTAYELSDSEADTIVREIERAAGRKVDATRRVDPDLIGGVVLRAGSMRVDASVRGRLERLRHELATQT